MFVPSTFLIVTGLSSFCSLNPCLAAIFFIHKHFCCTTIQECFHYYTFMYIYFLYPYIQLYFSQHFKCPPHVSLYTPSLAAPFRTPVHILLCCTSLCTRYTTTFQSHYGCFLLVLHSGHKILFLSSSDISSTISFLLYQLHLTLTTPFSLAVFSLYLHTLKQLLHYIFLKCSPEINPCFQFSCALVPL